MFNHILLKILTGCAWHVLATSSALAPYSIARTASLINSPATEPIICTPNNLSVFLSANTLTKPSVSRFVFALEFAKCGNFPTLYSTPSFFKSSSVLPTQPTSGCVYITLGTQL